MVSDFTYLALGQHLDVGIFGDFPYGHFWVERWVKAGEEITASEDFVFRDDLQDFPEPMSDGATFNSHLGVEQLNVYDRKTSLNLLSSFCLGKAFVSDNSGKTKISIMFVFAKRMNLGTIFDNLNVKLDGLRREREGGNEKDPGKRSYEDERLFFERRLIVLDVFRVAPPATSNCIRT